MITEAIHIQGLVQGVGFRPFVYRLARSKGIKGVVENRNDGVYIIASAEKSVLDSFVAMLRDQAPPASIINSITREVIAGKSYPDFKIVKSENISDSVTGVSPDICVCDECLADMQRQEHRISYPFINCTNCGPRFTIIRGLPYDRALTSMEPFKMCDRCRSEYENVEDRRFHAQPVACNECGPHYYIVGREDQKQGIDDILSAMLETIDKGGTVALKGSGGYHLICDAHNEKAVGRLRERKGREGKPLAVMCRDYRSAEAIAHINDEERKLLEAWQRPIVLLRSKNRLASSVSNGLNTVGVLLPYMPVHYMLFNEPSDRGMVFTSANFSEEPVIIDHRSAYDELSSVADLLVSYNREIYNRADDSVARIIAGNPVILRRSRGYVPSSVQTSFCTEGIFAAGSELVSTFAIGKGSEVILSQYIGDLKNLPTLDFYRSSYELLGRLYRFKPEVVVRDMHPDYLSSRFADELAAGLELPVVEVQHHHAHIASCMAENRLDEEVIGISLDGVGLGTDGRIWGGEVLLASYSDFKRVYHFDYVPIVGSDRVSYEPWRSGLAYLIKYIRDEEKIKKLAAGMNIDSSAYELFARAVKKGINSHYYSSAGRLFDAVASLTGVNTVSSYHAEAPMRLESLIEHGEQAFYDYSLEKDIISFGPAIEQIIEDLLEGIKPGKIAARFHNSVVNALVETVSEVSQASGVKCVVLSGGTFQNAYLTENLYKILIKYSYRVYLHSSVPQNDGGLSLGQLAVAASRIKK